MLFVKLIWDDRYPIKATKVAKYWSFPPRDQVHHPPSSWIFFLERTFTFLFFLVNNNKHKYELNRCVLLRNVFFFSCVLYVLFPLRTFAFTYIIPYVLYAWRIVRYALLLTHFCPIQWKLPLYETVFILLCLNSPQFLSRGPGTRGLAGNPPPTLEPATRSWEPTPATFPTHGNSWAAVRKLPACAAAVEPRRGSMNSGFLSCWHTFTG